MSLPIIDLKLADDPATRPVLLEKLKNALFQIGFFYLVNHGVEEEAARVLGLAPKLFKIPSAEKFKVAMVNNPHFVGYTSLGAEKTIKRLDLREQYDFGTAKDTQYRDGDPEWKKLHGPSAYLPDSVVPAFQDTVETYLARMANLSSRILQLVAESLELEPQEFDRFKGEMDRLKIIRYPPPTDDAPVEFRTQQGVGPHKDSSGMFTYVLQDDVGGLEVLDSSGEWLAATPLPGSFVVNIAQGFEALSGGRCLATTHRVRSPQGNADRYSVPYFQSVRLDLTLEDILEERKLISGRIAEVARDGNRRERAAPSEFLDPKYDCFGAAHLRNRIISHRDVSAKWYPELYEKYVGELEAT